MQVNTVAAVFDRHQSAIHALNRLVESGCEVGLLMSDREAERHFSASVAIHRDLPRLMSAEAALVACALRAPARIGMRGTGIVAAGPLLASLQSVGVGVGRGLRQGMTRLGLSRPEAEGLAERLKKGAVVVGLSEQDAADPSKRELLFEGSAAQLTLVSPEPPPKETLRPAETPVADQRPAYEPRLQPGGRDFPSRPIQH